MIVEFIQTRFGKFNFTDEELSVLKNMIQVKRIKRNMTFAEAKRKNTTLGVIMKGSLYAVSIDDRGEEIVHDMFYEGDQYLAFDYESYLLEKPLEVTIKTNEDSVLLTCSIQEVKNLYEKYPRLYQIEMFVVQQHFIKALNRIKILQEKDPSAKLKILQNQSPGLFFHFSFSQIASYLGVHRNTISRAIKKL